MITMDLLTSTGAYLSFEKLHCEPFLVLRHKKDERSRSGGADEALSKVFWCEATRGPM